MSLMQDNSATHVEAPAARPQPCCAASLTEGRSQALQVKGKLDSPRMVSDTMCAAILLPCKVLLALL